MPLKLGKSYTLNKLYTAHIRLLDNTIIDINLPSTAKGKDCLQKIAQYIGLYEVDYFGVQFLTKKDRLRWVETGKCLRKQLDRYTGHKVKEAVLLFKVHYFVPQCSSLQQEITRYLYYLQLKAFILNGRLKCSLGIGLKLAALSVQAELGTNENTDKTIGDLDQFILLPNYLLDHNNEEHLHKEILLLHKENRYSSLSAASAEKAYIQVCQQIEEFGCEIFNAKDKEGSNVDVWTSYKGVNVKYPDKQKPDHHFVWEDIGNMAFNRQNFLIQSVRPSEADFLLDMGDSEEAKYLWKTCVNQHQFFRMSHNTPNKTAFRTQNEINTDTNLLIKIQQSPVFQRRVTLTNKKAKERQLAKRKLREQKKPKSPSLSDSTNDSVDTSGVDYSEDLDETEFLHRYEDVCSIERQSRGSSSTTSQGSQASSSGYNTSDSEGSGELRMHPVATTTDARPVSLIFTRLNRIASEQRDHLLKHLEGVLAEDAQLEEEYRQIFTKKTNCSMHTGTSYINNNRDPHVLPYDDNKIVVNNNDGVNYINASPIKVMVGKERYLSYIAAQSPIKSTLNNFWQLIWDQNICFVVMMSQTEDDESICYWPEDVNNNNENKAKYGQMEVSVNFVNNFNHYSIRSMNVRNQNQTRTLFQIEYKQWPSDGKVPTWTKPFIDFLEEINSIRKVFRELNPTIDTQSILVHCADGSSRSGVVILAESLLSYIERNETLDIPITLAHLRTQRMKMIGNQEQYRFVHQLLADYLKRNRLI